MTEPAEPAFSYRAGLTHLRALSVVLVLLFHAGVVESGYIGVDVFFVLSGFLISSILWERLSSDRPTGQVLWGFYAKRCLRILPLSLLVLAVTAVASHFFFETLIDNWVSAGRAALVWAENWFLIRESNDYFASDGTNPFQQYWSLGVEEQFYVVLPLLLTLLLAAMRRTSDRAKLTGIGTMAVVGIVAALTSYYWLDLSVSEFYYSSFARSYQLLTGVAIMALVRVFGLRQDRRWLFAVGVVGLVLVGGVLELSVIWSGLFATLFAAACMLSSQAILVDSKWLERLGIWSYGIYLWHFPINEYLTKERIGTPPWLAFVLVMAFSTALSAFTFRFFEDPVRHIKVPNRVTFASTAMVIASLWVVLGLLATPAPPEVFAAESGTGDARAALPVDADGNVDLTSIEPDGRLKAADVERIEGWTTLDGTSVGACGLRDTGPSCIDTEGDPTVLLVGDSFANRVYQALRPLAEEQGWELASFVRPGCPWMDDVFNDVGNDISDRCRQDKPLLDEVVAEVDPDIVVIHSYPYREANKRMTRASDGEVLSQEQVAAAAQETIDGFVDAGRKVVFVEPTPFADDESNVDDCLKLSEWADDCDFEAIDVDSVLNQAMRERADEDPNVWFTSINDLFCEGTQCSSTLGDLGVMADQTHVSGGIWLKLRNVVLDPIQQAIDSN